jgi:hypothetical protein
LRQAYDYWQNQPGNYRAPGRPSALRTAPKYFSHRCRSRCRNSARTPQDGRSARPKAPWKASAFPRSIPQSAPSAALCPRGGCVAWGPREEKLTPRLQLFSVHRGRFSPDAQCKYSQRPFIHRAHPSGLGARRPLIPPGSPRLAVRLGGHRSGGRLLL